MTVHATSPQFKENAHEALQDAPLQKALNNLRTGFIERRALAAAELPEFEALRDSARDIKKHTLQHLDLYLEAYEQKVTESGGHVHFCRTSEEANEAVLAICRAHGARALTKGKSMISEEMGLNDVLIAAGITPVETDLGEYIIQLRGEIPSHIIAPAVHLNKEQVEADFRRVHTHLPKDRVLTEPTQLLSEARAVLRERFLAAEIGITGANFLIAETGTSVIVTNEGNGDLTQTLPKVHIVLASLEKLVPTLEDVSQLLRVLARSATGQDMSVYTTFSTGPRRPARRRRAARISRHHPRQWPLGDAWRRVRGHAALHPLRRLHESLSGLSCGGRPRVWLGLSRADGRGADAVADRRRQSRASAECLDVLRTLRSGLPRAHSAAENDAALARARIRAASDAGGVPLGSASVGVLRKTAGSVPVCDAHRHGRIGIAWKTPRPLHVAAVRRRLDQLPRSAGAAGTDISSALGKGEEKREMSAPKPKSNNPSDSLYERDFFLWTQQQAEALRKAAREGSNLPLDWENLAEETESLGRSFKHEVQSRIAQIIIHLWKLACSPAKEPKPKWRREAETHRRELGRLVKDSPSLRARVDEFIANELEDAEGDVKLSLTDYGELETAKGDFIAFKSRGLSSEEVLTPGLYPVDATSEFENALK